MTSAADWSEMKVEENGGVKPEMMGFLQNTETNLYKKFFVLEEYLFILNSWFSKNVYTSDNKFVVPRPTQQSFNY